MFYNRFSLFRLCCFILVLCILPYLALQADVHDEYIYDPSIKSVKFYKADNPLSYPVLELGKGGYLSLEFDELGHEVSDFMLKWEHCDADWQRSQLMQMEYFDGFNSDMIQEYGNSQNTLVPYIHYSYRLENQGFKVSGNYVLSVYRRDDEKQPVIVRRFLMVDNSLNVAPDLSQTPNVGERLRLQSVNFMVYPTNVPVLDPTRELNVQVMQNFRWDNMKTRLKPAYVYPNRYEYRFDAANDFPGGNEYRMFDTRNLNQRVGRVFKVDLNSNPTRVYIQPDQSRGSSPYTSELDFNGAFFTDIQNNPYPDTEADYLEVIFTLETDRDEIPGEIYLFGQFSDWHLLPDFKLQYVDERTYRGKLLLKQGVYNYHYVLEQGMEVDETFFEGTHFETENYYTILVYFRAPGERYDRLVGYSHVNYYEQQDRRSR